MAFQSQENAAIQVGIGELNQILDEVLGWETVSNTVAATPGREEQSDQQARIFRRETLAVQAISQTEAVFSNVRSVENVASLAFRENVTNAPLLIDGVTIPAHSVYACVDGGTDSDVALALLNSKTGGAGWHNGESANPVTENVVDEFSGQSYEVKFDRPDDVPTLAVVTASVIGPSVSDPETAIKDAILDYAAGNIPGEQGFIVGADVSGWELSGAITISAPGIVVREVLVSTVLANDPQPDTIPIELFQKASITADNISVTLV